MKVSFLNYLTKIAKKTEIQKQPKKKIKFLMIPCLDKFNVFDGLDLEASNIVRKKCFYFLKDKIDSTQFEKDFIS